MKNTVILRALRKTADFDFKEQILKIINRENIPSCWEWKKVLLRYSNTRNLKGFLACSIMYVMHVMLMSIVQRWQPDRFSWTDNSIGASDCWYLEGSIRHRDSWFTGLSLLLEPLIHALTVTNSTVTRHDTTGSLIHYCPMDQNP